MKLNNSSQLVHRSDILAILVSLFMQWGDRDTLLALSVAFQVSDDFIKTIDRINSQKNLLLEKK